MNSQDEQLSHHLMSTVVPIPRQLCSEDWSACQALLQQVHRRSSPSAYPAEYPLMLGPGSSGIGFGIVDASNRLMTHVGTLTRTLCWKAWAVKTALIGSVATAPEHEGQGLASLTLQVAHQALREEKVCLVFLWSEPRRLYTQQGYEPVGRSLLFRLTGKEGIQPIPLAERVELTASQSAPVLLLARPSYCTFRRTEAEATRLLRLPNMRLLGWRPRGVLKTVVAVGKGSDMPDICHEFWGQEEGVIPLLQSLQEEISRPVGLLLPDLPGKLLNETLRRGMEGLEMPAALGHILDRDRLLESLQAHVPTKTLKGLEALPDSSAGGVSLLTALLGPVRIPGLEGVPLPFHAWGLDSM